MKRVVACLVLAAVAALGLVYWPSIAPHPVHSADTAAVKRTGAAPAATGDHARSPGGQAGGQAGGRPSAVNVAIAKAGSLPLVRQTIGTIVPIASTALGSPASGIVKTVLVKDGAEVKAGDVLVQLDDRMIRAQIERDQAMLAKDQATLDEANSTLKRIETLIASGTGTQQQHGDSTAAVKQATALIAVDTANLAADNVTLSLTEIRAPFDGRLGAVLVSPGAYVAPGASTVVLTQMKPVFAEFTLAEPDLDLALSAMAKGELTATIIPTGTPIGTPTGRRADAATASGQVVFIDNAVDMASGTFKLRAQVTNDAGGFWPGQSLDVTVGAGADDGVVVVPAVAVQPRGDGFICFVVRPDQTIEMRKVSPSLSVGDQVGIAAGLADGEQVVVEGQAGLVDGAHVTVSATVSSAIAVAENMQ